MYLLFAVWCCLDLLCTRLNERLLRFVPRRHAKACFMGLQGEVRRWLGASQAIVAMKSMKDCWLLDVVEGEVGRDLHFRIRTPSALQRTTLRIRIAINLVSRIYGWYTEKNGIKKLRIPAHEKSLLTEVFESWFFLRTCRELSENFPSCSSLDTVPLRPRTQNPLA